MRGKSGIKQLQVPDINLNQELTKCKGMEDLVGKNSPMQRLFGNMTQQFLEAEMEEHLGREKYERDNTEEKDYRNGYSKKNIKTSFGEVALDVTRDRNVEFEPKVMKKYETVCNELDNKSHFDDIVNSEVPERKLLEMVLDKIILHRDKTIEFKLKVNIDQFTYKSFVLQFQCSITFR
jgi:hypothetical protein